MKREPIVEDGVVAGNVYDKYETKNPLARRLVDGFLDAVTGFVEPLAPPTIHEVGCGEGNLSARLYREGRSVVGSDFSNEIIAIASENARQISLPIEFKVASIYDLTPREDSASLVVCCEVLEHLEDPEKALETLAGLASPHLLVSVPREPLWRFLNIARGKYVKDLGNTPGHLQHWSKKGFIATLRKHVEVLKVASPIPWTIALCRANGSPPS